ncbi:MAG: cobalamin biosynthesis protein [Nitrospinae bacterium]|nr:cobalamin biosynthesis protein [Nitrospinota bacterium]MBF0633770.1 cobalamin biosynthesis protein [Nitrospinota bacterium]
MKTAFITLSKEGAKLFTHLRGSFADSDYFTHENVEDVTQGERFAKVVELTERVFDKYEGLVYIAPCGAVVRAIAPLIRSKESDPAVVQVDVGGRWAVSLLSGHEGRANELAVAVANAIGAEPVISTSTEASKNIIVGVGCRRGMTAERIVAAVKSAIAEAGVALERVRYIASADVKSNESGLIEAARTLGVPLRFIASDEIRESTLDFDKSAFVEKSVNLPAVAEPAALLAGRRTSLILKKRAYQGITVAIARERSLSLE